jgi:hypothetical protein
MSIFDHLRWNIRSSDVSVTKMHFINVQKHEAGQ